MSSSQYTSSSKSKSRSSRSSSSSTHCAVHASAARRKQAPKGPSLYESRISSFVSDPIPSVAYCHPGSPSTTSEEDRRRRMHELIVHTMAPFESEGYNFTHGWGHTSEAGDYDGMYPRTLTIVEEMPADTCNNHAYGR